jgi:hypothetical protein
MYILYNLYCVCVCIINIFCCYIVVARSAGNAFHFIITESAYCTCAPVLSAVYCSKIPALCCAGILEQSMGTRNRVRIRLSYRPVRLVYIGWRIRFHTVSDCLHPSILLSILTHTKYHSRASKPKHAPLLSFHQLIRI